MMTKSRIAVAGFLLSAMPLMAQPTFQHPAQFVDPFIGTDAHGHTYPGATMPFGMVQLSPDAGKGGWDWCSSYHYSDTTLAGFSHTHLSGTGCGDLGDILITPTVATIVPDDAYRARFFHARESARPGYYSVELDNPRIGVELTATVRAGFHRYTFPAGQTPRVGINLTSGQDDTPTDAYLKIENDTLITGYRFSNGWAADQKVFFAARFSRPIASGKLFSRDGSAAAGREVRSRGCRGYVDFVPGAGNIVLLKVGISAVDAAGALNNLDQEIPGWNFDAVKDAAFEAWDKELAAIAVTTKDARLARTFYTSLYHTKLAPTIYGDVDGRYRGADKAVHASKDFTNYTTFSLWDTYRAAHPLFTLVDRERVPGMINAMMAFARESGYLPVWPLTGNETNTMVGYHAIPVIADAYLKGISGFDAREAYALMKKSAMRNHRGVQYYTLTPSREALQELPEIPANLPQASAVVINGYSSTVSGDTINYHSSDPRASMALIVRAAKKQSSASWKTLPVPPTVKSDRVSFVWLAGIASDKGGHSFKVEVDGKMFCSFRSSVDSTGKSWSVHPPSGGELSFIARSADWFGDFFGTMTLTLPKAMLTPGKAVEIRVSGETDGSQDWYMTFMHGFRQELRIANEFGVVESGGSKFQLVRADYTRLGRASAGTIIFGKNRIATTFLPGLNTYYLRVPRVAKDSTVEITMNPAGQKKLSGRFTLQIPKSPGFIPSDKENESVSKALEYAFDDWCIAKMARALGYAEDDSYFTERSKYYRNLFDPATGFMRGKTSDGAWCMPFNPRFSTEKQPEYTEGNAWQYLFLVPHNPADLIALLGGRKKFITKLDSLFEQSSDLTGTGAPPDVSGLIGMYAHGNEPSQHIAYLYDYAGAPAKTQAMVHRIMKEFYRDTPDGLCGNEDCGQMSAWYVLSAMGIYPVNPAGGEYAIGSPLFDSCSVDVGNGKRFAVVARNVSEKNIYVAAMLLNGRPLREPFITHEAIVGGGVLECLMSDIAPREESSVVPKKYESPYTKHPVMVDGNLDEEAWRAAPWTDFFVDIEGSARPAPRFTTRAKIAWDETNLYIGAELQEPHVWGTLTKRDTVIYYDNDFEVFIDPDGDTNDYYELEINALNTVWDLMLDKPYRKGGKANDAWDIGGLKTAVRVRGTINNPADRDSGWTVEIAMPWKSLAKYAHCPAPPRAGDAWRLNFSRVEWMIDVAGGGYRKIVGKPEDNWVWSPQGLIDMHLPERWGYVTFKK